MTNNRKIPWEEMKLGFQRRVEYSTIHDYFWVVDFNKRYGFFMKLEVAEKIVTDISLKGIEIRFEEISDNFIEIFLFLEDKDEAEVFQALCFDLIFAIDSHESDLVKVSKLLERIDKWKHLLANRRNLCMSIEQQMGIYSEMSCLKNIIAEKRGYNNAINAWVGMEKDKQDFSMDDSVIEVKSHRTTKGNIARISSLSQLYSEKDDFYLVSYGLTISDQGETIDDVLDEIMGELSGDLKELLLIKLFEAGWIPHHDKLSKVSFIIDSETIYSVKGDFPRINHESIDYRIPDVKYKIDLSKCSEFICTKDEVFGGE